MNKAHATVARFNDRLIVDAQSHPWSALGRVNTGGRGYCTGVLINERHVLSQARCLYNAVEGRWWNASELYFVAGYQRDSYQGRSAVSHYRVAPDFVGGTAGTLNNLLNNWALITLTVPIGRVTGWMTLQWLDTATARRIDRGEVKVLDAGYRRGQTHVVTLAPSCRIEGHQRRRLVAIGQCNSLAFETSLATLLFMDGELRVLGSSSMRRNTELRRVSFGAGDQPAAKAALRAGSHRAGLAVRRLFATRSESKQEPVQAVLRFAKARKPALSATVARPEPTRQTGAALHPIRLTAFMNQGYKAHEPRVRRKPVPFIRALEVAANAAAAEPVLERTRLD